jgi:hypothetical protein
MNGVPTQLRRWAGTALVATAASLPFELEATLPLGPLRLSSVELFLYATLALWMASVAVAPPAVFEPRRWPRLHQATAGLAVVMLASAATAPVFRGAAIKFTLRSWSGMLLFAAAADLLREPRTRRRALQALVVGASIAAALTVAEVYVPGAPLLLRPFHGQVFQALGMTRGSGPFQFPNIAAMVLEAALPVSLGLGSGGGAAALAVLMLAGVLATGSRAGLVVAAVALLAMAGPRLRDARTRATAGRLLIAAGLVVALGLSAGGALTTRLAFWRDGRWYHAVIAPAGGPSDRVPGRLPVGVEVAALVRVQNRGGFTWPRQPPSQVHLSYHWLDGDTGVVRVLDGKRTPLPADVPPGGEAVLRGVVRAPDRAGRYLLAWDVVQEGATWFRPPTDPGFWEPVLVGDAAPRIAANRRARDSRTPSASDQAHVPPPPSRLQLWRAAIAAFRQRPLLGVGPDNFRHVYAQQSGADERLHANNLYVETLADLGIAGLAALAALIVALARAMRRAISVEDREDREDRAMAYGVSLALGAFLLHGTLDYFFEFTPTYVMFWLLAGALAAMDSRAQEMRP